MHLEDKFEEDIENVQCDMGCFSSSLARREILGLELEAYRAPISEVQLMFAFFSAHLPRKQYLALRKAWQSFNLFNIST